MSRGAGAEVQPACAPPARPWGGGNDLARPLVYPGAVMSEGGERT